MYKDKFWLVWNPTGNNPSVRHNYEADALGEAERLASINPGIEFYVLEALSVSKRVQPVETVKLTDVADPFGD